MKECEFCDATEDEVDALLQADEFTVCGECYHDGATEAEESLGWYPEPGDHFAYFEEP